LPDKLHHTRGIVLRTVKYGETSIIVSIYTELFGLQGYLVNGVRAASKKGGGKANYFQPGAILEMVVYHNELKQLHRIKEFKWAVIYRQILINVPVNAVALFMIELLTKCVRQTEANPELYHFAEDALTHLDMSSGSVTANFPLYFSVHLPVFFGFRISNNYSARYNLLDLQEGNFVEDPPTHSYYLSDRPAAVTSELLRIQQPSELSELRLNHEIRRILLQAFEDYFALHLPEFGRLKTLPVLRAVL
jgi:DNA repair protein RecO (recombination protein O)